jgi:succinyldiaminopimelate transaminase
VGTPVDPTPEIITAALIAHAQAPGYPLTAGMPMLRSAIATWCTSRLGADETVGVLPVLGSKELVAWLPTLLSASTVLYPEMAYPTYDVGARLAGAEGIAVSDDPSTWPAADLVWINSPGNPTGRVLSRRQLEAALAWAREHRAVLVSDECYLEFGWEVRPESILAVAGSRLEGVLSVHSLSKRSNMAGYRAAFLAGDPSLIARLLEVRKHAGMMVSTPVQHAMIAALGDSAHVDEQRARYASRREQLRPALERNGFSIHDSEAGLYLWASRQEECWKSVDWLAERGILVAPGSFYGEAAREFVRFALTATDERISAAVSRLT